MFYKKSKFISFRGFYSRKYIHDYRKRREYLKQIQIKNSKTLEMMNEHAKQSALDQKEKEEMNKLKSLGSVGQKLHYLVSTESINGVYNGVVTKDYRIGNMRVEDYLRQCKRINT